MCVTASASETLEAPGAKVPFSLEPILIYLEGGHYVGLILQGSLANILAEWRPAGGGGISSSGDGGGV